MLAIAPPTAPRSGCGISTRCPPSSICIFFSPRSRLLVLEAGVGAAHAGSYRRSRSSLRAGILIKRTKSRKSLSARSTMVARFIGKGHLGSPGRRCVMTPQRIGYLGLANQGLRQDRPSASRPADGHRGLLFCPTVAQALVLSAPCVLGEARSLWNAPPLHATIRGIFGFAPRL